MVMEEAIKDKTIQVKQQLKDEASGKVIDRNQLSEHLHCSDPNHAHHNHDEHKSDDEDNFDEEEEKIMREIRERRLGEMKNDF